MQNNYNQNRNTPPRATGQLQRPQGVRQTGQLRPQGVRQTGQLNNPRQSQQGYGQNRPPGVRQTGQLNRPAQPNPRGYGQPQLTREQQFQRARQQQLAKQRAEREQRERTRNQEERPYVFTDSFTFEVDNPAILDNTTIKNKKAKNNKDAKTNQKIPYKDLPKMPFKKKLPDYTIWLVLTAVGSLMSYLVYSLNMLDFKLLILAFVLVGIICLSFWIGIKFRKKKTWRRWVSRVAMTGVACVFAFGSYTIYNGSSALYNMMNKESIMKVSVITKNGEAAPESIESLAGKTVGYAVSSDKNAVCYAISELSNEQSSIKFKAYSDYNLMYEDLQNSQIDSIIVPNTKEQALKREIKGYEETVKQLKTYSRTNKTKSNTNLKLTDAQAEEPFVVYLSGIDEGDDPSIDALSDVNILLFINQKENMITTVSIPRDTYVPNPAYQNGSDKLTHLGINGVYNSIEGLEKFFGIDIDYYAKINFYSLIELVDAMGGIDVDVEIAFTEQNENRSFAYNDLISLDAGEQHLNGKQALAYSRHRKTYPDGTAGRERAQQRIIKAMVKKLCSPEGIAKINSVLDVAETYVDTDIPLQVVQSIIKRQTASKPEWKINSVTLSDAQCVSLTTVSMPSMPLSCQLVSENDIKKVYNTYLTLQGEGMPVEELNKKIKALDKAIEEAEETGSFDYATNTYILPDDIDQNFMDNLELPKLSEYAITLEEQPYLNDSQIYYGLSGDADETENDTSAKLKLVIPNISKGYYNKVSS